MTLLLGSIVFYSRTNQNGLIQDPFGNTFYFDCSVLKDRGKFLNKNRKLISNGRCLVEFKISKEITHIPCCSEVKVIENSKTRQKKLNHFEVVA